MRLAGGRGECWQQSSRHDAIRLFQSAAFPASKSLEQALDSHVVVERSGGFAWSPVQLVLDICQLDHARWTLSVGDAGHAEPAHCGCGCRRGRSGLLRRRRRAGAPRPLRRRDVPHLPQTRRPGPPFLVVRQPKQDHVGLTPSAETVSGALRCLDSDSVIVANSVTKSGLSSRFPRFRKLFPCFTLKLCLTRAPYTGKSLLAL